MKIPLRLSDFQIPSSDECRTRGDVERVADVLWVAPALFVFILALRRIAVFRANAIFIDLSVAIVVNAVADLFNAPGRRTVSAAEIRIVIGTIELAADARWAC